MHKFLLPYRFHDPKTGLSLGDEWYRPPPVVRDGLLRFLRGGPLSDLEEASSEAEGRAVPGR